MNGPSIIQRSLSRPDNVPPGWQYHPRSDHHSKVSCWAILFDLLQTSRLLRKHAAEGLIGFGLNHKLTNFRENKSKRLDLVLCRPAASTSRTANTFSAMATRYGIPLEPDERDLLAALPMLLQVPVGAVLVALEAKAAMTEHGKACPRLYDELNSSHSIVHGHDQTSIAAGLVMVNTATEFYSPTVRGNQNGPVEKTTHKQPEAAERVIRTVERLPRRSSTAEHGFDALAVLAVDCRNDGAPVTVLANPPAPEPGSSFHYETLINRVCHTYQSRFPLA